MADNGAVDAWRRKEILSRYIGHTRRFEAVAAKRAGGGAGEDHPANGPLQRLEQEPTQREIEVLQLISDGLVNRGNQHPALPLGGQNVLRISAREAASPARVRTQ